MTNRICLCILELDMCGLSSTASQFEAEAVMALLEVTDVVIKQYYSAVFLILRAQLLHTRLDFRIELKGTQWKNNSRQTQSLDCLLLST